MSRTGDLTAARACLARSVVAGAVVGVIVGVALGLNAYRPTAPFALVEGAIFGSVIGLALGAVGLALSALVHLVRRA